MLVSAALTWYIRTLRPANGLDAPVQTHAAAGTRSPPNPGLAPSPDSGKPTVAATTRSTPRDSHEWTRLIVDTLIARGDPQSLSAAAILMGANALDFTDPTDPTNNRTDVDRRRASLALKAASGAPNDAAIQALALMSCLRAEHCDPTAYETRLPTIDAANAWTSAPALQRAVEAGDKEKQAEILRGMASGQRFDNYRARLEALVSDALQSLDVPFPPDAHWDATPPMQRLLAQTMNVTNLNDGYGDLFKACGRSAPEEVPGDCRRVAKLMLDSDDDAVARDGLELASAFARPGSADAAQIAEARRRYDWQVFQTILLPRSPEQNARFLKERLGSSQLRRELLQEHGVPLEPPPDWVSPTRENQ